VPPAPLEWLALAAGLFLTLQYAWLLDDAYVYFRYVDNWIWLDNGLVYNRGEFVEGYTSPFWTLLLGGLRLSGLDYWILVRGIGVVAFACFWALMVVLNRRLSPPGVTTVAAPLLALTFNYAAISYFTSGTESPFVALSAPVFALFVMKPDSRPLQTAVAVTPLVRPELALIVALAIAWSWWNTGRPPWLLALLAACTSGGWLVFRVYYYADLVPNTFHLKNTTDVVQGLHYLADTLVPWGAPFAVLALAGGVLARRSPGSLPALPERGMMLAVVAILIVYVVRIGGDARHFRYLIFPFLLLACATSGIAEAALTRWISKPRVPLAALAVAIAVTLGTFVRYPHQLSAHPLKTPVAFDLAHGIVDAMHHRRHERLPTLDPWRLDSALTDVATAVANAPGGTSDYRGARSDLICWFFYEDVLRTRALHSLGLTEPFLAHLDPVPTAGDRPAHRWGLIGHGRDLARLRQRWGREPARGMLRADVASGAAPAWIAEHLESLEVIERRAYNQHAFVENLRLALMRPPRITPRPRQSSSDSPP
jgi:hypothetical protein